MKTYFLVRNAIGAWPEWVNLYVTDDEADTERGRRRALPYCIGNECNSARHPMKTIAIAILLDYLAGEEDSERKAIALSRAFANKLSRIGSGGRLTRYNATSWSLSEEQVERMVTEILCDAANVDSEVLIEEIGGERRDLLRATALMETIIDRMLLK